jgi:hypothetical protein
MIHKTATRRVEVFNKKYAVGEPLHYYAGPGEIGKVVTLKRQAYLFNSRTPVCEVNEKPGLVSLWQIGPYVKDDNCDNS